MSTAPGAAKQEDGEAGVSLPSVEDSLELTLLPFVLSVIAGTADVISFLGLGGLFTAHITGNLVILAAHLATGGAGQFATIATMLSVPVFMAALLLTKLFALGLESLRIATLRPLLFLHFLLLSGFLAVAVAAGPQAAPDAFHIVVAGMLGVSAMAVQNALAQISIRGAPATAVMTTNVVNFVIDATTLLAASDDDERRHAASRTKRTWPAIVGFAMGCALGAAVQAAVGLWSLAGPAGLALLALALAARSGVAPR